MKNRVIPQVFIFIALDCEALPLLKFFHLKKDNDNHNHPFSIYTNHNCVLTVTGVGKVPMAGAVAYTLALFPDKDSPVLLNIGIAGHKTQDIGDLFMAMKIVDEESGKRFYPQLIGAHWAESSVIKTSSLPCEHYSENSLHDMEASAFYEMAIRFSSIELIHCIKIVSDNELVTIDKIQPKLVTEWIANQMTEIERLIVQLEKLRNLLVSPELKEYEKIIAKWHFTVTGKIKLKTLLLRWDVLSVDSWLIHNDVDFNSGKELLRRLEKDVNNLDVYL